MGYEPVYVVVLVLDLVAALIDMLDAETEEEVAAARANAHKALASARGEA